MIPSSRRWTRAARDSARAWFASPAAARPARESGRPRAPGKLRIPDAAAPACFVRQEPLEAYLASVDYASSSTLRRFARGGMEAVRRADERFEHRFGEAFHALLLEPHRFAAEYVVPGTQANLPVLDETTLLARTWLTAEEYARLVAMRDAVRGHHGLPLARLLDTGVRELSIYWRDEAGGRWKARPDCFDDGLVAEIKTAIDVGPRAFARARRRFGYDLQAAHHLDGIERLTGRRPRFVFVAVEALAPHYVWIHEPTPAELDAARRTLDELRVRYRAALSDGAFPSA